MSHRIGSPSGSSPTGSASQRLAVLVCRQGRGPVGCESRLTLMRPNWIKWPRRIALAAHTRKQQRTGRIIQRNKWTPSRQFARAPPDGPPPVARGPMARARSAGRCDDQCGTRAPVAWDMGGLGELKFQVVGLRLGASEPTRCVTGDSTVE